MSNSNVARYLDIVKGRVRQDLESRIKKGEIRIGSDGSVTIPVEYIDIPQLEKGSEDDTRGAGKGHGKIGDAIEKKNTTGKDLEGPMAGRGSGKHLLKVFTLDEFLNMLSEKYQLPNLQPKSNKRLTYSPWIKWNGERRHGPMSLLRFQSTFLNAMAREKAQGTYSLEEGVQTWQPDDMRFLSYLQDRILTDAAVVIYTLDLSGSMYGPPRKVAREISAMFEGWLRRTYPKIEKAYILHDDSAWEVPAEEFFEKEPAGGTYIAPALVLANKIVQERYPPSAWNIYLVQFTDGFTLGTDNDESVDVLTRTTMPAVSNYYLAAINIAWGGNWTIDTLPRDHFLSHIKTRIKPAFPDKTRLAYITSESGSIDGFVKLMKGDK